MLSDGPPWREDLTTSRTCLLDVDVNALTSSGGMSAPASVPHETITARRHHWSAAAVSASTNHVVRNVATMHAADVSHTRFDSGRSKSMRSASRYRRAVHRSLSV